MLLFHVKHFVASTLPPFHVKHFFYESLTKGGGVKVC
jgi:hypothetical protein